MESFGVLYIWKEPVLTVGQINRLSNIFDNAGNVFLAIGVVAPVFSSFDNPNWLAILAGGGLAISSFIISLFLAKKGELP